MQVGDEGAGHFVKMVHNGIEYGDMQLICEAYHLMKDVLGMDHDEMAQVSQELLPPIPADLSEPLPHSSVHCPLNTIFIQTDFFLQGSILFSFLLVF